MKRGILIVGLCLLLAACGNSSREQFSINIRVKKNSFSWRNSCVTFQAGTDMPAFRAWVTGDKKASKADVYGLGFGASAPMGIEGLYYPSGYSSAELLMRTPEMATLVIHYPEWEVQDVLVQLDKQITIYRDCPVIQVIDFYSGGFDALNVAAGLPLKGYRADAGERSITVTATDGTTASIYMPEADETRAEGPDGHAVIRHMIRRGEPLYYYIGVGRESPERLLQIADSLSAGRNREPLIIR